MWSLSCVGSKVWNLHWLHLNLISWIDEGFVNLNLLSSIPSCNSAWTFWTWSLISVGLSELNTHLLHLKLPILYPIECLGWYYSVVEGLYLIWDLLILTVSYWSRACDWQSANLWALNFFWLKVENPQSSQRIGRASLSTEYLLFFWNKPWALLMCSRKRVFQVVL